MKITDNYLRTFIGVDEQSEIPIFQRRYEWKEENVLTLLDDIVLVANNNEDGACHFIGSIMYKSSGLEDGVEKRTIIDGQQRLTTISILLLALEDYLNQINPKNVGGIKRITKYQYNSVNRDSCFCLKLKHNGPDLMAYSNLMKDRSSIDSAPDNPCVQNYSLILSELKKRKIDPMIYVNGIERLRIVDILIEKSDDAEAIFETVNTTGLDLTNAEIIKNFILMTIPASRQTNLYTTYWYPMESHFCGAKGSKDFDAFFKYYLRTVTGKEVDENKFYLDFKEYVKNSQGKCDLETIVSDELYSYYEDYLNIRSVNKYERSDKIKRELYFIGLSKNDIVLPVLLKVAHIIKLSEKKYKNAKLDKEEKKSIFIKNKENGEKILSSIDSYLKRRTLCGYESKTLGKVWQKMLEHIFDPLSFEEFKKFYDETAPSEQQMPGNDKVIDSAKTVNVYGKKKWLNCVLSRIENHFEDDCLPEYHGSWTIEHIMPQTIYSNETVDNMEISNSEKDKLRWENDLGGDFQRIHDKYLHTMGNLSLLGYRNNSAIQNFVFLVKKDTVNLGRITNAGYSNSSLKITSSLSKYSKWGEKEIIERSKWLGDAVIAIWPYYK